MEAIKINVMKKLNFAGFTIVMCVAVSCRSSATSTLEVNLFEQTLSQTPKPQLIDVRTPQEYGEGHLPGAILMNVRDAGFDSLIRTLDKTRPVFVYCRTGKRSLEAATVLEKHQFKAVYNLEGGIVAWKNKGKTVISD